MLTESDRVFVIVMCIIHVCYDIVRVYSVHILKYIIPRNSQPVAKCLDHVIE